MFYVQPVRPEQRKNPFSMRLPRTAGALKLSLAHFRAARVWVRDYFWMEHFYELPTGARVLLGQATLRGLRCRAVGLA